MPNKRARRNPSLVPFIEPAFFSAVNAAPGGVGHTPFRSPCRGGFVRVEDHGAEPGEGSDHAQQVGQRARPPLARPVTPALRDGM